MRLYKYIYVALAAFGFASCTEDINLKLDSMAPELVVEGVVNTDTTTHTVYLKKSADYFSNKPADPISDATVTLSDGVSTITLTEAPGKKGAYSTSADYFGVVGRTYTLTISNVDMNADGVKEQFQATSTIPTKFQVDKISVNKERSFGSNRWLVNVWMQDPPNERNYYLVKAYRNDTCVTDSMQLWGIASDEIFKGYYLDNVRMMNLEDIPSQRLRDNDKVTLELSGISEDYMYFINDVIQEYWGRNPLFGGQPANVRTNIKQIAPAGEAQNAHGFFAAYSTTRASTVYKKE
ncbi:MAG: hypothetical protein BGN96_11760 [Bacteroidales bacterium 45-6]|nr:MAG: hypothetical protein BGN96_11760 [Bacteroidales bacterium 45-6]